MIKLVKVITKDKDIRYLFNKNGVHFSLTLNEINQLKELINGR